MITFSIRTRRTFTILKIFKDWSKDAQDSSYNTPHVYKYRVFDLVKDIRGVDRLDLTFLQDPD